MSFLPFFDNTVGPYLMYNFFQKLYIMTNQILHYVREYLFNQGKVHFLVLHYFKDYGK